MVTAASESVSVEEELLDKCHIGSGINPGYKSYENRTAIDVTVFDFWSHVLQSTVGQRLIRRD